MTTSAAKGNFGGVFYGASAITQTSTNAPAGRKPACFYRGPCGEGITNAVAADIIEETEVVGDKRRDRDISVSFDSFPTRDRKSSMQRNGLWDSCITSYKERILKMLECNLGLGLHLRANRRNLGMSV